MQKDFPVKKFFSYNTLLKVAESRGFYNEDAVLRNLAPYFGRGVKGMRHKLRGGFLTREDTHVIGAFFQMSPKEFTDTFLHGLFVEVSGGRFECHVDDFEKHLEPLEEKKTRKTKKKSREEEIEEMLNQLDEMRL